MSTAPTQAAGGVLTGLRRHWPLAALGLIGLAVYASGLHAYVSWKAIGLNYESLRAFISGNLALGVILFMALYVVVVALSLPGAAILTMAGGLLFGWRIGGPATVVAATVGATILYLVARTSLGEALARKSSGTLARVRDGFQSNALSYLLFLRLVPVAPFFAVNIAAAVLGVPLRTYVLGTLVGIIPGTFAFSFAGSGLGSVIEAQNAAYAACRASKPAADAAACAYTIDTSALINKELLAAFALLGLVALLPVAVRRWRSGSSRGA